MANFDPLQNSVSSMNCEKVLTANYVREANRYANLGANPSKDK